MKNRLLGFMVSCCTVVACSSSSGGGSPATGDGGLPPTDGAATDGGITPQAACTALANARCAKLAMCSQVRLPTQFQSMSDCVSRYTTNCVDALSAPSAGGTPAATQACSEAYAGWACTDVLDDQNIPQACQQKTGTIANGAGCAFPAQCQSGFCSVTPNAACGTCAAPPKAGDSCAELTTCGQGLICTADTHTCTTYVAAGGSCGKGAPCGTGLTCVGADATTGVMGKCETAVSTMGASCDSAAKTMPACSRDAGLTCNSTSMKCETIGIAMSGGQCGNDVAGQLALCAASGVCTGATATAPGTCTAAAADGSTCATTGSPACETLSRCIVAGDGGTAGTCQMVSGSACP
jgi:hypothetical protein